MLGGGRGSIPLDKRLTINQEEWDTKSSDQYFWDICVVILTSILIILANPANVFIGGSYLYYDLLSS
jgi:hypothetical protein